MEKSLKERISNLRKDFKSWGVIFFELLITLPFVVVLLPVGLDADYERFKWIICIAVISTIFGLNVHTYRIENLEQQIDELVKEIEKLKKTKQYGI